MLTYQVYKMIHFIGLALALVAIGGASGATIVTGGRPETGRKKYAISHGIGMFLILLGGFGMLARMGIHSMPNWVIIKLLVWLALAGWIAFSFRLSAKRPIFALLTPAILAAVAVWSVLFAR